MEDMAVRLLLLFPIIAAPLLLGSLPALAQGQPSAEQLLQQLRPKGNLINGTTRGLRLAPPGSDAPGARACTYGDTVHAATAARRLEQACVGPSLAPAAGRAVSEPDGQLRQRFG